MTGVHVPAVFTLLGAKGQSWPVKVGLHWSPTDPLALRFRFPKRRDWHLARELLVEALTSDEAGDGDVQFWSPEHCPDCVGLTVDSPSGHAEFHAPREALIELIVRSEPLFRPAVDAWHETWRFEDVFAS